MPVSVASPVFASATRADGTSNALDIALPTTLTADRLYVLAVFQTRINANVDPPTSVSGGGGTWRNETSAQWKTAGTGRSGFYVYTCVPSSPSGNTITVTPSVAAETIQCAVIEVIGSIATANGADAVVQDTGSTFGSASGGTLRETVVATMSDTTNNAFLVFGHAVGVNSMTGTADASPSMIELYDASVAGGTRTDLCYVEYAVGVAAVNPSIGFTISNAHDGSYVHALEIAAASSPSSARFRPYFITG